jgi:hypothetical protein
MQCPLITASSIKNAERDFFSTSQKSLTRISKKQAPHSLRDRSKVQFLCLARRICAPENPFNRRKPYRNKPQNTLLARSEVNLDQTNRRSACHADEIYRR